ncbi:MAG TPA: peroxiredoxin [Pelomicrobium sp.]|nr:peroxiredoxin [Pelomicrobium sp.]
MLAPGQSAPEFDLPNADMEMVRLAAYRNKNNVVLYFYPKDDTPGCTLQAVDFSDMEEDFLRHDTIVLAVSRDDCISHGAFRDKHGLSIQLLADTEGEVCELYGVLQEREVDGRLRKGLARSTFVIDKKGIVRHALYGVAPKGHAHAVLELVKRLGARSK